MRKHQILNRRSILNKLPALVFLLMLVAELAVAQQQVVIRLDAHKTYQTIDGFGASDAWRTQFVGKNWPLEKESKSPTCCLARNWIKRATLKE